jgi:hypothetical protein
MNREFRMMRKTALVTTISLAFTAPCLAQSTPPAAPPPAANQGVVLSPLPSPDLPPGSTPSDYLRAAQAALATGQYGEAEDALEKAQTRILDRSVPLFQTNSVSDNPATVAIAQARQALQAHDRAGCMQSIQTALAATAAQGM